MKRLLLSLLASCLFAGSMAQEFIPEEHALVQSTRPDGRMTSTYAVLHQMLKDTRPKYAYRSGMNSEDFAAWQDGLRSAMAEIMKFPPMEDLPAPKLLSSHQREGYTLEKWEFYPLPKAAASFLVLKPDNCQKALPAVLCIPGAGRTKEGLAGEPGLSEKFTEDFTNPRITMALDMVKEGYIAVAVDNAAAGEQSDLESFSLGSDYDYDLSARLLLELGWSWLGYTSFLDFQVLQWMKEQPFIDAQRIVVSGFSLGTEPMMVLGVLDRDIFAFVYNDFLCQTQERALVMTMPGDDGKRSFPNTIRHLIPSYWHFFNFPDVLASLAPRPIIFTEGGLDRDFRVVASAYNDCGKPENAEFHHYPKFADPATRNDVEALPEGMSQEAFFDAVNVDPPSHYFKHELILPWLKKLLNNQAQ